VAESISVAWSGPFQVWRWPDEDRNHAVVPPETRGNVLPVVVSRRRRKSRPSFTEWSLAVRKRDGACVECGATEGLHAHHIKLKSEFPELAFDLDNGEAFCRAHHRERHPKLSGVLFGF